MITKQPKLIKLKDYTDKDYYKLPSTKISCILQDREANDDSRIVYINNPKYIKGAREEAPYISLTKSEYTVVEWSE